MQTVGVVLISVGLGVGLLALAALHALPTGLSPVRNPVSQYGISDYRAWYRVQTVAYALAGAGAALGLAAIPNTSRVLVGLCALFALSRAAISWFPMDLPGGQRTPTGRRHGVLAVVAFAAVGVAAERLSILLGGSGGLPALSRASAVLAVLMLVSFLAMGLDRRSAGGRFGLIERAFYGCMTAWLVVVAVLLAVH